MSVLNQQPGSGADTAKFLQAVVPWDSGGYVTINWHLPGRPFSGKSCRTIDDAMAIIAELMAKTRDNIYFCISSQKLNSGHRDRKHAISLICLPMDMDIKPNSRKHYGTPSEAITKLLEFCVRYGVPRPSFIVITGGGLHVYWLSDRPLPVEEWQDFADALKAAAGEFGLKIDGQCTGDAARVLRVPDTMNYKYDPPRPVRLSSSSTGARYDFAKAFGKLKSEKPAKSRNKKPAPGQPKVKIAESFKDLPLPDKVALEEYPPVPLEPILNECGWLRHMHETGGIGQTEPLWKLMLNSCIFLIDGESHIHKFSEAYDGYDPKATEAKFDTALKYKKDMDLGYTKCQTICDSGSTHCKTCPRLKLEKSPLNIGLEAVLKAKDEDLEELGGTRPPELRLPEGFCLDEEGRVCAIMRARKTAKGIQPAGLLMLISNRIGPPSLQFQDGRFNISFTASTDRGGMTEVLLTSAQCYEKHGLLKQLAEKAVMYNPEADKIVDRFMVGWFNKLRCEDVAIQDHGALGWHHQDGKAVAFAYGNVLYHEDGSAIPITRATNNEFYRHYTPTGHREAWLAACKLLTDRKRPELDIIISIGFAAPLMTFAGTLYGAILSIWGNPGTAKSTAQQVAAAVWGHPKQTRESLNSTPKSVQGRLGRTRNLAAYWDDIQDEKHQDALFQTMFVATQGAEGGRLNQDASYKERLEWQTLLVACSNASFIEYLTRKQKSTTAGMRRVFEIRFDKKPEEPGIINVHEAGKVFKALEHNFGRIGAEYARMLATEHKAISAMVDEITKDFMAEVNGDTDEAYWWGICGVLIVGATLACRLGAEIDVPAMRGFLIEAYYANREIRGSEGTEGGSYENTERALAAFLNDYKGRGNAIWTDKVFENRHHPIEILNHPEKDHPILRVL